MTKPRTIKKASNSFFRFLRVFFIPILYLLYRFKFERETSKNIKRPCLILSNHQTGFDQFAVGVGFRFAINFVASDSIFRHGFRSWLMKVLVQPIPYSKGSTDSTAIKDMFSVIRQGGAIGMFPSGNRSFFGDECTLKPGIGKLAQKLGVPVVLVRLCGGYNVSPRWKFKPTKGKMRARVTKVISVEDLKSISHNRLDDIIINELYFNEFEWNRKEQIVFQGKHTAEHLEIVLFYCPECNKINTLSSKGNEFFCTSCQMRVTINETGFFEKINNAESCPDNILDWSKLQLDHIKTIDYSQYTDKPIFSDDNVLFSFVIRAKRQDPLGKGTISLYGDKINICDKVFPVEKINDMAIQSMRGLSLYTDEGAFTALFPEKSCLIKYMICGYHLKNEALNIPKENRGYGY